MWAGFTESRLVGLTGAPLNNTVMSQRVLKHLVARHTSPAKLPLPALSADPLESLRITALFRGALVVIGASICYNPELKATGRNPSILDLTRPDITFKEHAYNETRFSSVARCVLFNDIALARKNLAGEAMINLAKKLFLGSILIATTLTGAHAQDSLSIEQLKDGLYAIFGSGGNVGVRLTSEGVILIDDKYPRNFDEIQRLVGQVSDLPVKYVINTHHHGDHSGGNVGYIDIAEILIHKNARDNMIRGNQDAAPRLVFTDETAIYLGGVEVRAIYMGRGHTNGDAVIYFPDLKTVQGGDLLHGISPFIDYGNGGSSRGWVATINNMLELDFDTAIPGHGGIMDRDDVVGFRNQMEAVRARMADLIRSGMPKNEASVRIKLESLSWTMREEGLLMQRSIPGLYDEVAAELQ